MTAIFLVPEQAQRDEVVSVLEMLTSMAKGGDLTGMIFGVAMKGQKYYCDAAGSLHRNGVVGLGVACMLKTELESRMQQRAVDTMI